MRTNFGKLLIILVRRKYGSHGSVKKFTQNQIWVSRRNWKNLYKSTCYSTCFKKIIYLKKHEIVNENYEKMSLD